MLLVHTDVFVNVTYHLENKPFIIIIIISRNRIVLEQFGKFGCFEMQLELLGVF